MKKNCLLAVIFCLFSAVFLAAGGNQDDADALTLNNEWVLCVTSFEYALSPARHITGDVIARNLVDKLDLVSYRLRISPEYAYYESYAWQQAVNTVAKSLSTKQNERSQQLYRGDPDWRYRANIKKIDADIEKLQEELALKEAEKPLINREPSFRLSQSNLNGNYPLLPKAGGERRFCRDQNSDAFLTGEIREFHGRYYIKLRLFTLYTNSYVYEDDIIFSLEDIDGAVEEISARLTAVLAGNKPAAIAVTAVPEEAQILINRSYAGTGTVEARERPPGTVIVAVAAEGFASETIETELAAGELTEVNLTLGPLHFADVHINAPGNEGSPVYYGSLFMGMTPLNLTLPIDQLHYVSVENWIKQEGKGVFTSPPLPGESYDISFKLKTPPPGQRRVNKARNQYYWGWAGTWVTGIAAWLTYGIYTTQRTAYGQTNTPEAAALMFEKQKQMGYVSTGAIIATGVAVAYEVFQMMRYLYTATDNVTPIMKQRKHKE